MTAKDKSQLSDPISNFYLLDSKSSLCKCMNWVYELSEIIFLFLESITAVENQTVSYY